MTTKNIELSVSIEIIECQLKASEQMEQEARQNPDKYSASFIRGYKQATKDALEVLKRMKGDN